MELFYIQLNTDRFLAGDEEEPSQRVLKKSCCPIGKAVVEIPSVHTARTGDG